MVLAAVTRGKTGGLFRKNGTVSSRRERHELLIFCDEIEGSPTSRSRAVQKSVRSRRSPRIVPISRSTNGCASGTSILKCSVLARVRRLENRRAFPDNVGFLATDVAVAGFTRSSVKRESAEL